MISTKYTFDIHTYYVYVSYLLCQSFAVELHIYSLHWTISAVRWVNEPFLFSCCFVLLPKWKPYRFSTVLYIIIRLVNLIIISEINRIFSYTYDGDDGDDNCVCYCRSAIIYIQYMYYFINLSLSFHFHRLLITYIFIWECLNNDFESRLIHTHTHTQRRVRPYHVRDMNNLCIARHNYFKSCDCPSYHRFIIYIDSWTWNLRLHTVVTHTYNVYIWIICGSVTM